MANSTIPRRAEIYTASTTYSGTKTIPSSGYLQLGTIASGKTVVSIFISSWGSNSGAVALVMGSGNTLYLIGENGAYIRDMAVTYAYYAN